MHGRRRELLCPAYAGRECQRPGEASAQPPPAAVLHALTHDSYDRTLQIHLSGPQDPPGTAAACPFHIYPPSRSTKGKQKGRVCTFHAIDLLVSDVLRKHIHFPPFQTIKIGYRQVCCPTLDWSTVEIETLASFFWDEVKIAELGRTNNKRNVLSSTYAGNGRASDLIHHTHRKLTYEQTLQAHEPTDHNNYDTGAYAVMDTPWPNLLGSTLEQGVLMRKPLLLTPCGSVGTEINQSPYTNAPPLYPHCLTPIFETTIPCNSAGVKLPWAKQ